MFDFQYKLEITFNVFNNNKTTTAVRQIKRETVQIKENNSIYL